LRAISNNSPSFPATPDWIAGPEETVEHYEAHGLRFEYPRGWELSEQTAGGDVTLTVQSEGTCYWSVSLLADRPAADRVLRTAVEAFEQEYPEVDVYPARDEHIARPHEAKDLQFFQFELVNSAFLRAFPCGSRTVLVIYQGTDHELEAVKGQLERITASLDFDEQDQPIWPV
jgi:hypothetical protein